MAEMKNSVEKGEDKVEEISQSKAKRGNNRCFEG